MVKRKKSKEERKHDRETVELYHKKITEDALEPLYEKFNEWKSGELPYFELTEHINFIKRIKTSGKCLITMVGMMIFYYFKQKKT
jgi:hypothetical protein